MALKIKFKTYRQATLEVRRLGIKTLDEYFSWARGKTKQYGKFPADLPRAPHSVYRRNGWTNWNDFLGTKTQSMRAETAWEKMYRGYCEYVEKRGDHMQKYVHANAKTRNWVNTQRRLQRAGRLDPSRKKRLDAISFVWFAQESSWEKGFDALIQFQKRVGHCRVPQLQNEGTFKLGAWVARQRSKKGTMPAEHRRQLDAIGFSWR